MILYLEMILLRNYLFYNNKNVSPIMFHFNSSHYHFLPLTLITPFSEWIEICHRKFLQGMHLYFKLKKKEGGEVMESATALSLLKSFSF